MRKKRLLVVGLVASMTVGVVSCGKKEANPVVKEGNGEVKEVYGDEEEELKKAGAFINQMYTDGAYFNLHMNEDEEDDIIFLYNSDKHCYAEVASGGQMYFDNSGHLRIFTNPYQDTFDVSPVLLVDNAIQMAKAGKGEVEVREVDLLDTYNDLVSSIKTEQGIAAGLEPSSGDSLEKEEDLEESGESGDGLAESSEGLTEGVDDLEESGESLEESDGDSMESVEVQEDESGEGSEESTDNMLDADGDPVESVEVQEDESLYEESLSDYDDMTPEEMAEAYLGWSPDSLEESTYKQLEIAIRGRDNIYELYSMTLGDKAKEIVDTTYVPDENGEDDALCFSIHTPRYDNDYQHCGAMLWVETSEDVLSGAWWFEGYLPIGGDWKGLSGDWYSSDKTAEEVKTEMEKMIDGLSKNLTSFIENEFGSDKAQRIVETEPELVTTETEESKEGDVEESKEGEIEDEESTEVVEIGSIERKGAFKLKTDALLEKDGISDLDVESLQAPTGYTVGDRDKMIDIYKRLTEWDRAQSDGTLVSPLSPDEVEFASKYIKKCEEIYEKDNGNDGKTDDVYGTIYWKDTVGVFIEAINN